LRYARASNAQRQLYIDPLSHQRTHAPCKIFAPGALTSVAGCDATKAYPAFSAGSWYCFVSSVNRRSPRTAGLVSFRERIAVSRPASTWAAFVAIRCSRRVRRTNRQHRDLGISDPRPVVVRVCGSSRGTRSRLAQVFLSPSPPFFFFVFFRLLRSRFFNACIPPLQMSAYRT
jgi:hypothetical protein